MSDGGEVMRAVAREDVAWLEKHGPFRMLIRPAGIQEICDRRGTPLVITCAGHRSRRDMEHWVLRANTMLLQSAVQALLDRLEEVQPAIENAFAMAWVHGQAHEGATYYGKELNALRRLV